jgi:hypothetical protein
MDHRPASSPTPLAPTHRRCAAATKRRHAHRRHADALAGTLREEAARLSASKAALAADLGREKERCAAAAEEAKELAGRLQRCEALVAKLEDRRCWRGWPQCCIAFSTEADCCLSCAIAPSCNQNCLAKSYAERMALTTLSAYFQLNLSYCGLTLHFRVLALHACVVHGYVCVYEQRVDHVKDSRRAPGMMAPCAGGS